MTRSDGRLVTHRVDGGEVIAHPGYTNRDTKIMMHQREIPSWEARMASILIERWGTVVAKPDGEDSAGRAKLRRATPAETVQDACDTAALAVAEFRKRGWVDKIPSFEDFQDAVYGPDEEA